jgi:hypothetical protein
MKKKPPLFPSTAELIRAKSKSKHSRIREENKNTHFLTRGG